MRVVASFYPTYITALNVVKEVAGVELSRLSPPGVGCLHDFSPSPDDVRRLAEADVLVVNGAGMESFLAGIDSRYPKLKVVDLSDGVELLREARGGAPNPHVWTAVSNAVLQARNMAEGMAAIDPARAVAYRKNAAEYAGELEVLRSKMHGVLDAFRGERIVTFHEAFPYFAREFGLEVVGVLELEPGSEPGAREMASMVDLIRKSGVKAVFAEPQYPDGSARAVARETGAGVYLLDPVVSGPDSPDAYIRAMERNMNTLAEAFKSKK